MGGSGNFFLQLQGPGIYHGGEAVTGELQVFCHEDDTKVKDIQIGLQGFCDVCWDECNCNDDCNCTPYTNHEQYISEKLFVHSGALGSGSHIFPFSFLLPSSLPCTFKGDYGEVKYFIEAEMDRSGIFTSNKRVEQMITIASICDLNNIPKVLEPLACSNSITYGIMCCKSKPLSATVTIPRQGYIPGEIIPVTAVIENHSGKDIISTKALISQVAVFKSKRGRIIHSTKTLTTALGVSIGPDNSFSWNGQVETPFVAASSLQGCTAMEVFYRIEFMVDVRFGSELILTIPIMIGNVSWRRCTQGIASEKPDPSHNIDSKPPIWTIPNVPQ